MTVENIKEWKPDDAELISEIGKFIKAVKRVETRYYKFQTYDAHPPLNVDKEKYTNHLERVFAYELYHQWSGILGKHSKWILNAEISKDLNEFCSAVNNEGTKYPDLVLHEDQGADNQMMVCEIKRNINIHENIRKDVEKLIKLTNFTSDSNKRPYKCGILLIINSTKKDFQDNIKRIWGGSTH